MNTVQDICPYGFIYLVFVSLRKFFFFIFFSNVFNYIFNMIQVFMCVRIFYECLYGATVFMAHNNN